MFDLSLGNWWIWYEMVWVAIYLVPCKSRLQRLFFLKKWWSWWVPIWQAWFPTAAIYVVVHAMKTYHIYAACACVEFCRALWSLWETYHAFKIKICTSSTLGLGAKTCFPFRSTQICTSSTLGLGAKTRLLFRSTQNSFTPTLRKTCL